MKPEGGRGDVKEEEKEEKVEKVEEERIPVTAVSWLTPGEDAAKEALARFLAPERLRLYADDRNDQTKPQACSNLSPYLHFGQLAPQVKEKEKQKKKKKNDEKQTHPYPSG